MFGFIGSTVKYLTGGGSSAPSKSASPHGPSQPPPKRPDSADPAHRASDVPGVVYDDGEASRPSYGQVAAQGGRLTQQPPRGAAGAPPASGPRPWGAPGNFARAVAPDPCVSALGSRGLEAARPGQRVVIHLVLPIALAAGKPLAKGLEVVASHDGALQGQFMEPVASRLAPGRLWSSALHLLPPGSYAYESDLVLSVKAYAPALVAARKSSVAAKPRPTDDLSLAVSVKFRFAPPHGSSIYLFPQSNAVSDSTLALPSFTESFIVYVKVISETAASFEDAAAEFGAVCRASISGPYSVTR